MRDTIKKTELVYMDKTYQVSFNFEVIDILEENFGITLDDIISTKEDATINDNLRRALHILYALIASEDEGFVMTTTFRDFKKSFALESIIDYAGVIEEVISNAFPQAKASQGKPKARRTKAVTTTE